MWAISSTNVAGESAIVARFEVKFGDFAGVLHVVLPAGLIEPVRQQLDAGAHDAPAARQPEWSAALSKQLGDARLELRAALVQMTLTLRELRALKPGDVIPADLQEAITVSSGGAPLFRARFGASRGYNALRIIERINPAKASRNAS